MDGCEHFIPIRPDERELEWDEQDSLRSSRIGGAPALIPRDRQPQRAERLGNARAVIAIGDNANGVVAVARVALGMFVTEGIVWIMPTCDVATTVLVAIASIASNDFDRNCRSFWARISCCEGFSIE
jgi:hypothetical protein